MSPAHQYGGWRTLCCDWQTTVLIRCLRKLTNIVTIQQVQIFQMIDGRCSVSYVMPPPPPLLTGEIWHRRPAQWPAQWWELSVSGRGQRRENVVMRAENSTPGAGLGAGGIGVMNHSEIQTDNIQIQWYIYHCAVTIKSKLCTVYFGPRTGGFGCDADTMVKYSLCTANISGLQWL